MSNRKKWGDPGSCVKRVTEAIVISRGARKVIVTIYPDGVLGLRLSKHRKEEQVSAASVYRWAVTTRVAHEKWEKKQARKKGGKA